MLFTQVDENMKRGEIVVKKFFMIKYKERPKRSPFVVPRVSAQQSARWRGAAKDEIKQNHDVSRGQIRAAVHIVGRVG